MDSLPPVYIVSAVRTPLGGFQGSVELGPTINQTMRDPNSSQVASQPQCCRAWFASDQRYDTQFRYACTERNWINKAITGALERAQGIKAEDVEEVFFGNVLSAK